MSFTPYNAPLLSSLLGDVEIAANFSVKSDIDAMLKFEAALARAQSEFGLIPEEHIQIIEQTCLEFEPDMMLLQSGVAQDGMAVPELIRQLRLACGDEVSPSLHFGSTSQDVVDTSLALRLVAVNNLLNQRLTQILEAIEIIDKNFGDKVLLARTRMQAALPVTVTHRLEQWHNPLEDLAANYEKIADSIHVVQLGGPVGTLAKMNGKGPEIRVRLAQLLELNDPGEIWHTDRTRLATYCNWLAGICSVLGKVGQDIVLMAQNGIDELSFEGAGSSSAMAHKQNPVKAEMLVTLARFSATLVSGMHHNAVHEQERSGISWTYEWLVVPQLCVVAGASLRNANLLLRSVTGIGANEG
ncbi:MAG: 3-carboxy-cis,cis-muconate cycloisomerase [Rhizobiaceae bacterium]